MAVALKRVGVGGKKESWNGEVEKWKRDRRMIRWMNEMERGNKMK